MEIKQQSIPQKTFANRQLIKLSQALSIFKFSNFQISSFYRPLVPSSSRPLVLPSLRLSVSPSLRPSVSPSLRHPLAPSPLLFSQSLCLIASLLFLGSIALFSQPTNLNAVDATIGNVGILLQPTRPTVQLPNQMVRFYPVRADYLDDQISFFPLTISSHRKGELFGVMPYLGEPKAETWGKRQTYDHELEVNRPFYYSTLFVDNNIKTEFAPGAKCGFFKFSFPGKGEKFLALRIVNQGSWELGNTTERRRDGGTEGPGNSFSGTEEFMGMKAYVYGEVNQTGQAGKLDFKYFDPKRTNPSPNRAHGSSLAVTHPRKLNSNMPSLLSASNRPKQIWLQKSPDGILMG